MTPSQERALIENVLELRKRLRHVEGLLEGMLAHSTEHKRLLDHLVIITEHVLRLIRQKEALLQAAGTVALANVPNQYAGQVANQYAGYAEQFKDLERAMREMTPGPH